MILKIRLEGNPICDAASVLCPYERCLRSSGLPHNFCTYSNRQCWNKLKRVCRVYAPNEELEVFRRMFNVFQVHVKIIERHWATCCMVRAEKKNKVSPPRIAYMFGFWESSPSSTLRVYLASSLYWIEDSRTLSQDVLFCQKTAWGRHNLAFCTTEAKKGNVTFWNFSNKKSGKQGWKGLNGMKQQKSEIEWENEPCLYLKNNYLQVSGASWHDRSVFGIHDGHYWSTFTLFGSE